MADYYINIAGISKNSISKTKLRFIDMAHRLEILCEMGSHYGNDRLIKFFDKCLAKGIKIYCISDFHLNESDIWSFMKNLKIEQYFSGIFVSSDAGCTKQHCGDLFGFVLEKLELDPQMCFMIGDNKKSDVNNAKRVGLKAVLLLTICFAILRVDHRMGRGLSYKPTFAALRADVRRLRKSERYEEYIVLFYSFTKRLYERLKADNADRVVFLSREGQMLKRFFDKYQELIVPQDERIRSCYFRCSRRAISSIQKGKNCPWQCQEYLSKELYESLRLHRE